MSQIPSQLGKLLGSKEVVDIFFWQTLGAILQASLAPEIAALQQESFKLTPTLPLSPEALADAVVRGHRPQAAAADDARRSGLDSSNFQTLIDSTGQPLPLLQLLEAWRRGIIAKSGEGADSTSLEQGIRESDLKNKWTPVLESLQFELAPPGVVIEAWLRSVIDEATARADLYKAGIDDATATLMYKAAGRPPSPQELADAYHRGLIGLTGTGADALTLEQGFLETDLKNKWWPIWLGIQTYLPPPRTITALIREGSMTDEQGLDYFKKAGLDPVLAQIYVHSAHNQKQSATKDLAKADVVGMYAAKEITATEATQGLEALGYSADDAALELGYADFKVLKQNRDNALSRLRSLYIGHKLSKSDVLSTIDKLGVASAARDSLLAIWDLEAAANVAILTAAEVAVLFKYNLMSADDAINRLEGLGFSADDAWYRLAAEIHAKPTDTPPAGYTGSV